MRDDVCLISSTIAIGVFFPWFKLIEVSSTLEVFVGILCLFLIGSLILFIAPFIFAGAHIISIISYAFIIIKYRTDPIDKKMLIILTILLLPNIILYKDVYEIYHAVFTLDWWGNAEYFRI